MLLLLLLLMPTILPLLLMLMLLPLTTGSATTHHHHQHQQLRRPGEGRFSFCRHRPRLGRPLSRLTPPALTDWSAGQDSSKTHVSSGRPLGFQFHGFLEL